MSVPPKAILFDFDGVLARTMEDNFRAWKSVLQAAGADIDSREYYLLEGMKLAEVARVLCEKHGVAPRDYSGMVRRKEELYLTDHEFSLYPGVEKFTLLLADKKVPMAIVTAGLYERVTRSMPPALLARFGSVITGDKTEQGKPFPDPYLKAAEELGVSPEGTVVVENAPLGIESAKRAGAYCIAICSTLGKDELTAADEIVPEFKDLEGSSKIRELIAAYS